MGACADRAPPRRAGRSGERRASDPRGRRPRGAVAADAGAGPSPPPGPPVGPAAGTERDVFGLQRLDLVGGDHRRIVLAPAPAERHRELQLRALDLPTKPLARRAPLATGRLAHAPSRTEAG